MPTPPSQPPEAGRSGPTARLTAQPPWPGRSGPTARLGAQPPGPAPQPGPAPKPGPAPQPGTGKTARRACPREVGRPLPDPAAVRLCAVPDTAPPYDDEALAGPMPADGAHTAGTAVGGPPDGGGQQTGDDGGHPEPLLGQAGPDRAARDPGTTPGWPNQFAQVLAETLAGSRPPRQIVPWTTQRARSSIQRLGPTLAAGQPSARQRPLVRRVVTSRPSCDVLEMTVIVGFGPRIRALAVRLERSAPHGATVGRDARTARWLCTDVEAA
jgi:Family of unknown function (DUF6459)